MFEEERSYTDSTTNSNIDRDLDFDSTVTSNINGYAWCSNKAACFSEPEESRYCCADASDFSARAL